MPAKEIFKQRADEIKAERDKKAGIVQVVKTVCAANNLSVLEALEILEYAKHQLLAGCKVQ